MAPRNVLTLLVLATLTVGGTAANTCAPMGLGPTQCYNGYNTAGFPTTGGLCSCYCGATAASTAAADNVDATAPMSRSTGYTASTTACTAAFCASTFPNNCGYGASPAPKVNAVYVDGIAGVLTAIGTAFDAMALTDPVTSMTTSPPTFPMQGPINTVCVGIAFPCGYSANGTNLCPAGLPTTASITLFNSIASATKATACPNLQAIATAGSFGFVSCASSIWCATHRALSCSRRVLTRSRAPLRACSNRAADIATAATAVAAGATAAIAAETAAAAAAKAAAPASSAAPTVTAALAVVAAAAAVLAL